MPSRTQCGLKLKYNPYEKCDIDTVYDNGSIKYKTVLGLKNVGLFEAEGFMYNGKITYDGKEISSFSK